MLKEVEYNNNYFSVFYTERVSIGDFSGVKSIVANKYFEKYPNGISVAGSRDSIQVLKFSKVADLLNKNVHVFIPTGKDTEMIQSLYETNANINRVPYGYRTVLNKRSRDFAIENDLGHVQVGMMEEFAFNAIADIYQELLKDIDFTVYNRILFPVGSGTSLIGFCRFCERNGIEIPIVGVSCGMNVDKIINKYINDSNIINLTIVESSLKYEDKFSNGLDLNETYEAKLLEHVSNGDLLITVDK